VETYSGHRLHTRPRRFKFEREWLEVAEVVGQWQEPENLTFLVTTNDARQYVLKYYHHGDTWKIDLWPRSGPAPG